MRTIAVLVMGAALLASADADAGKKPAQPTKAAAQMASSLYSMEVFTQTGALLKDLVVFAATSAYDALPPPAQESYEKAQTEVTALYNKHGKKHVDMVTSIASVQIGTGLELLQKNLEGVNVMADTLLEKFEKQYPTSKGKIPAAAGDRVMMLFYLLLVLSWAWWVLRKVMGIACCFICCCGMCSKRKSDKKKKGDSGKAPAPKPKPKMKK